MRWHDACVCELRKRTDQLIIQQPEPAYGQDDEWIDEVVTLLKDWRGR